MWNSFFEKSVWNSRSSISKLVQGNSGSVSAALQQIQAQTQQNTGIDQLRPSLGAQVQKPFLLSTNQFQLLTQQQRNLGSSPNYIDMDSRRYRVFPRRNLSSKDSQPTGNDGSIGSSMQPSSPEMKMTHMHQPSSSQQQSEQMQLQQMQQNNIGRKQASSSGPANQFVSPLRTAEDVSPLLVPNLKPILANRTLIRTAEDVSPVVLVPNFTNRTLVRNAENMSPIVSNFDPIKTNPIPYCVLSLQSGRALNSWYGREVNPYSSEFLLHEIYGGNIVSANYPLLDFDPQDLLDDEELFVQMLTCWPNLMEKLFDSYVDHHMQFWSERYVKHSKDLNMLQMTYLREAISMYKKVGPIANLLLKYSCGKIRKDGRKELRVMEFLDLIKSQHLAPPTFHVHEKDGFQELRELKFYEEYYSRESIHCPDFLKVDNSVDNSKKVNHLGIQPYDSNVELYIV